MKKIYSFFAIFVLVSIFAANLMAQPQYYNYMIGGIANSLPFNQADGSMVQTLITPGEFANPTPATGGNITSISFRIMATMGPLTYSNFKILMGQTTDTVLPAAAFYSGTMTEVFSRASVTYTAATDTWLTITLDVPFIYNPYQSLVIQIEQRGATGTLGSGCLSQTATTTNRRCYSVSGYPFVYGGVSTRVINCGVNITTVGVNSALLLPTPGSNTNYVSIPHNAAMVGFPNITIEAWVKLGSTSSANAILNKGAGSFDYQFGINPGGIPYMIIGGSSANSTGLTVTAGVWTHIAATYDGANVRFYKDGVLASTIPFTTALGTSTNEMRIARGNGDPFSGDIDELRLWSVVRTDAQIFDDRCKKNPSSFTSTTGLLALWHLDNNLIDAYSGFNGTINGTVSYDFYNYPDATMSCPVVGISPNNAVSQNNLDVNYPNPFNQYTMINYQIVNNSDVVLKVYDIMGKEIATLVNTKQNAGKYEVKFSVANLPAGIYVYQLRTNNFSQSKRMMIER